MWWIDLLFALILALLLAWALVGPLSWRHPHYDGAGVAGVFLFLLLLGFIWAGGVWSEPYGPEVRGSYLMPFVVFGLALFLIILALGSAIPPRDAPPQLPPDTAPEPAAETAAEGTAIAFGFVFWLLALGLLIAAIVSYLV